MNRQKALEKLQKQQVALLQKRQAAASRLQHFNSVKDRLEADESIIRSVELIDALNKIDEQLETIQHHLDVG